MSNEDITLQRRRLLRGGALLAGAAAGAVAVSAAGATKAEAATSDTIQRAEMNPPTLQVVSRTWSKALMTGALCAIVLAALCALLLEQLDHSLHSVSDLEPLLPAGVLGTMPLLTVGAWQVSHLCAAKACDLESGPLENISLPRTICVLPAHTRATSTAR